MYTCAGFNHVYGASPHHGTCRQCQQSCTSTPEIFEAMNLPCLPIWNSTYMSLNESLCHTLIVSFKLGVSIQRHFCPTVWRSGFNMAAHRNSVYGRLPWPNPVLHVYSQRERPSPVNKSTGALMKKQDKSENQSLFYTYTNNIYKSFTSIFLVVITYTCHVYTQSFHITP